MKTISNKKSHNAKEIMFMIFLVVVAIFVGVIPLFLYKFRQLIIDLCLGESISIALDVFALLGIFLALVLVEQLLGYIKDRASEAYVIKKSYRMELSVKKKVTKLKYSSMENEQFTALLSKVDALSDNLTTKYSALFSICVACVYLVTSIYTVCTISLWMVVAVVCLLGLDVFLNVFCAKKTKGFWAKYMFTTRKANYFSAILTNREYATEKKVLDTYDFVQNKFEKEFEAARASNIKLGRSRLKIEVFSKIVSCLFSVAILLIMFFPLLEKTITLGTYCSLFFLLNSAVSLIDTACAGIFEMGNAQHGLKAVNELLSLPEENLSDLPLDFVPTSVEFKNVCFSYPGTEIKVLDNVSFKLDLKGKYAIVGENGCGKSTLVKLLLGLYQPDSGSICVDGRQVETLGRANINSIFSAVFQNSFEYPLTLRENIFVNNTYIANDKLANVCGKIGLTELVEKLPNGLDTNLSLLKQNSVNLSGGEWQKVAIARCLLANSSMAVLDEPNAALDPFTEMQIYRAYSEILKDRGAVLITHRLGSIKDIEKILVIKDGQIEAFASHEELMQNCEYYKQLYLTQRSMYYEK